MLSPEEIDILFPDIWEEDGYVLPNVDITDFTRAYPDYEQTPIWDSMTTPKPEKLAELFEQELGENDLSVPDFDL